LTLEGDSGEIGFARTQSSPDCQDTRPSWRVSVFWGSRFSQNHATKHGEPLAAHHASLPKDLIRVESLDQRGEITGGASGFHATGQGQFRVAETPLWNAEGSPPQAHLPLQTVSLMRTKA
jgi:hypothetical protein